MPNPEAPSALPLKGAASGPAKPDLRRPLRNTMTQADLS